MSEEFKIFLRTAILSLIILVIILFAVWPFRNKVYGLSRQYLSDQETLISIRQKVNRLNELEKENKKAESAIPQFEQTLINDAHLVNFIETLENLARSQRVSFGIQLINNRNTYNNFPANFFQIAISGSYQNALRYILSLENKPFYLTIDNVQLRRLESRDLFSKSELKPGDVSASLTVVVFK